jgi:hypothetical protein
MNFKFYGYTVRSTTNEDLVLALEWTASGLDAAFWLKRDQTHESFLVLMGTEPIGFFQDEFVTRHQVRLHMQASPVVSRKKFLRALTKLVPLIEKALALAGVRAIFFTSHSPSMVTFMQRRLQYRTDMEFGTLDGQLMWKMLVPAEGKPKLVIQ